MSLLNLLTLAGGLVILALGADVLVRASVALAGRIGLSSLVVGLTVVAFGTSAPELAVSVQAGLSGNADIAVANVVGSNVLNVLLILGACAAIAPLVVARQLVRLDVPLLIGASAWTYFLAQDGRIARLEGSLLVVGLVAYLALAVHLARRRAGGLAAVGGSAASGEAHAVGDPPGDGSTRPGIAIALVGLAAGGGLLVLGARLLVSGAVALATALGIGEDVIGLTIVAAGTSLPEVATSIIATLRGERDIAIGNVVGSNLFNLLGILGIASAIAPGGLAVGHEIAAFDLPVMLVVATATLPIFLTGSRIDRWEGALFLGGYVWYVTYLVLRAGGGDDLVVLEALSLAVLLPIAVTLLVTSLWFEVRRRDELGPFETEGSAAHRR